jgi:hypothetical protein
VAPAAHQSGSVEGSLERVPPRSRAHASLERVPPRAGSASLEGSPPPRPRLPHTHTCSRTRVRAFNALTRQSRAIIRLGITPRRCSANSLGEPIPATIGDCTVWPVSAPWHCAAHSRTTNAPRPRRGACRTLEPFPRESAGSNHDVKPVGTPSPPLWHHARHCCNNSSAVEHAGTGRRHACHCALYGSPSTASSSPSEDATANHYAFTLEAASVQVRDASQRQDWSKSHKDGRQLPGAARHTPTCS